MAFLKNNIIIGIVIIGLAYLFYRDSQLMSKNLKLELQIQKQIQNISKLTLRLDGLERSRVRTIQRVDNSNLSTLEKERQRLEIKKGVRNIINHVIERLSMPATKNKQLIVLADKFAAESYLIQFGYAKTTTADINVRMKKAMQDVDIAIESLLGKERFKVYLEIVGVYR